MQAKPAGYDACSPHPTGTIAHLKRALPHCVKAATTLAQHWCASGLYHASIEYVDIPFHSDDFLYPCTSGPLSGWCFQWMFAQLMYQPYGAQQLAAWKAYPKHVTQVCFEPAMRGEQQRNGCVWGLSWPMFIFYHEVWVAHKQGSTLTPLEVCLQVPISLTSNGFALCPPLIDRDTPLLQTSGSNSSLVDWCALFVPGPVVDAHGLRLWRTCIESSTVSVLFQIGLGNLKALDFLAFFCRHDLPWQNAPEWREMEAHCIGRLNLAARDKLMITLPSFYDELGADQTEIDIF